MVACQQAPRQSSSPSMIPPHLAEAESAGGGEIGVHRNNIVHSQVIAPGNLPQVLASLQSSGPEAGQEQDCSGTRQLLAGRWRRRLCS